MSELCNLRINLNGQHTFFLNEDVLSRFSGTLKKMIKQAKRRKNPNKLEIEEFPGGYNGFELVTRFCYSNGKIVITSSNVSILHCCSIFLEMTEKFSTLNLLCQTEKFLEGIFEWSWTDIMVCLKNTEQVFHYAVSYGLLNKLICALLAHIAQNSDANAVFSSPSSSSSSNETNRWLRFSFSSKNNHTPESAKPCSSSGSFSCKPSNKEWWFEDLNILSPKIIERLIKSLGIYGADNNSITITRFLLQYLKTRNQTEPNRTEFAENKAEYGGLADTAIQGVIFSGKTEFSCRKLFWVLRVLSNYTLSKESRTSHERLIGEILDQATLDDLLISGRHKGVYDVDFVIRLQTVFVNSVESNCLQKLKKIGKLIDVYLGEISPDQSLKVSKFLGVAEILPDSARDCFDGVYRAIDIYLEAHPSISFDERSNLCRCLNYEKLTFETCKELARNPKIPPNIAVQALKSQNSRMSNTNCEEYNVIYDGSRNNSHNKIGKVLRRHSDQTPMVPSPRKHKQFDLHHPDWTPDQTPMVPSPRKHKQFDLHHPDWTHDQTPTVQSPRKHKQFDLHHPDWTHDQTPMVPSPRKHKQFDLHHPDWTPDQTPMTPSPRKHKQYDLHHPDWESMVSSPRKQEQFDYGEAEEEDDESEEIRFNLERMQWRVVELEKVCKEMKGQMSRLVKHSHSYSNSINSSSPNRTLPKLC